MKTLYKNTLLTLTVIALLSGSISAQTKKTSTAKPAAKTTAAKKTITASSLTKKTPATKPLNSTPVVEAKQTTPKPVETKAPVAEQKAESSKPSLMPAISNPFAGLSSPKNKVKKVPSQESSFKKGSRYLGGNLSFGSSTSTSISLFGELGVTDYLSVGASTMVASSSYYRTFYLGGDATLHFANLLKLGPVDPYVGVTVGYNSFKDKSTGERNKTNDPTNGLRSVGQIGVNYYITPKMVAFIQGSVGLVNASPFQYGGGVKFGL